MSADGDEKRKPLAKWIFRGALKFPYVVQCVVAESEIVPHIDGLEQVTGDKVFESGSCVRYLAPVPLIPSSGTVPQVS